MSRECSICGLRRAVRNGYLYCIRCDPEAMEQALVIRAGRRADEVLVDFEQVYRELVAEIET